jgi:hypothetical protein
MDQYFLPEKSNNPCPKNMPRTKIFIYFWISYEEKCWVSETNCGKIYLSGKESSVVKARSTGSVLLRQEVLDQYFLPEISKTPCPKNVPYLDILIFCGP